MKLVRLSADTLVDGFDCGDEDLNNFLIEDAKGFLNKRIANSFILEDEGTIVAYFCLLNDKISKQEVTNSQWRKIKDRFPDGKRFSSYPAIKIGRFTLFPYTTLFRSMNLIKDMLNTNSNYSAFRFITVDAYLDAILFYEKNGFTKLTQKEENDHTRLMFFDMMELP